jgi:hypothetical protein
MPAYGIGVGERTTHRRTAAMIKDLVVNLNVDAEANWASTTLFRSLRH